MPAFYDSTRSVPVLNLFLEFSHHSCHLFPSFPVAAALTASSPFFLLHVTAHDVDEQHQELCLPSVWAGPELPGLAWTASSHPLWRPPLQLRRLRRSLHRHQQLQQVGVTSSVCLVARLKWMLLFFLLKEPVDGYYRCDFKGTGTLWCPRNFCESENCTHCCNTFK